MTNTEIFPHSYTAERYVITQKGTSPIEVYIYGTDRERHTQIFQSEDLAEREMARLDHAYPWKITPIRVTVEEIR